MDTFSDEEYDYSRGPSVFPEEEEAQSGCDQIKYRESPLSRFGAPDGDDDRREKGDINYGDGDGDYESLSILKDYLSLRLDDVHDPLGSITTHRV